MADINDQVVPELAEDFLSAVQVPSGVINPNISAIAEVEAYRRILSTTRETVATLAATVAVSFLYTCPSTEARLWRFARLENNTGVKLLLTATLQRGNSSRLLQEVLRAEVDIGDSVVVIGPYARNGLTVGDMLYLPDEFVQPDDSDLTFKIEDSGGGVIGVGEIEWETGFWRQPPLRRWRAGRPNSTIVT